MSASRRFSHPALWGLALVLGLVACAVPKEKFPEEASLMRRSYHNVTAKYNGYYNADLIYDGSRKTLSEQHQDNYNRVLPLFTDTEAESVGSVSADLDKAVEKLSLVIALHRPSDWVDDAYLLLGQSKYLKQDYEGAQEAFEYLIAEYNPEAVAKRKEEKKRKKGKRKKSTKKKKKGEADAPVKAPKPDKFFLKKRPAYEKGLVWLVRTHIERGNFKAAEELLYSIERDPKLPKRLRDDIAEARAYYFLEQKKYEDAIAPLELALKHSNKRSRKVRYAYILAQIHQQAGRGAEAYAAYKRSLKYGPSYAMEFSARLNMAQNSWLTGKGDAASAIAELERLLRDPKNRDYKDQIYFAIAKIAFQSGDKALAESHLKKALASPSSSKSQKGEAYLMLADIYYETEKYVAAKFYYDSTLQVLPATDERYPQVSRYSLNLTDVANNIQIIELQDSLLRIAAMDVDSRRALAASILAEREKQALAEAKQAEQAEQGGKPQPIANSGKQSSFFAYNERNLKRGQREFEKKWGQRALEDDWRRSNRQGFANLGEDSIATEQIARREVSEEELAQVFADVPKTEAEIKAANDKIMEAMYKLGTLYRDRLQNDPKAIAVLEEQLRRYPGNKYEPDVLYYLFLLHNDRGNSAKAQQYADQVLKKYPESSYARFIKDPSFVMRSQQQEKELLAYYDATYAKFSAGEHKTVLARAADALKTFGERHALRAKFDLLAAMSLGATSGREAYVSALKEVVAKYPDTPEQKKATEIMRYLDGKAPEPTAAAKPDEAADKAKPSAASDNFEYEPQTTHYIMVVLPADTDLSAVKESVNAYNEANFAKERLRASNIFIGADASQPTLVLRRFADASSAMAYYKAVSADEVAFLGNEAAGSALIVVVSQDNYRQVLRQKSLEGYEYFFQENYE